MATKVPIVLSASLALAMLIGEVIGHAQTGPPSYDVMSVTLPQGEPRAGRQAFLDLKCQTCHRVAGERDLQNPAGEIRGPDLDRTLKLRPMSEVAEAIIVPSHSMSVKTSAEVRQRLQRTQLSPMGDFSRSMTVRQLADLLAYLGSIADPH